MLPETLIDRDLNQEEPEISISSDLLGDFSTVKMLEIQEIEE